MTCQLNIVSICYCPFSGNCKYLKSVEIQISAEDYFEGTKRPGDMKRFKSEMEKLKVYRFRFNSYVMISFSHLHHLDESILTSMAIGGNFSFLFHFSMKFV